MQSDEDLVRACRSGNAEAWRIFVDLYSGWVQRVARASLRRLTGTASEADAEDVVSDVFRQLVDRNFALLRSLRAPYHLRAWLAIITRRAAGRLTRRRIGGQPAPAPEHEAKENTLAEILGQLSPADRLLLELFFVHDCSYQEIAQILGVSVESIGKQKTRALLKLRSVLGKEPG